jgi:ParB family chromosome partitioning protein
LSVREVEQRVSAALKTPLQAQRPRADRDVARLEEDWSQRLGTTVQIKSSGKRGGKLVLSYRTLDELDQFLNKLG